MIKDMKKYLIKQENDLVKEINTFACDKVFLVENTGLLDQCSLIQVTVCIIVLYIAKLRKLISVFVISNK